MRTIKETGLLNLIKEGDLPRCKADIYAVKCLTSDLTLQEVIESLSIIEDISNKYLKCEEKYKEIPPLKKELNNKKGVLEEKRNEQDRLRKSSQDMFAFIGFVICLGGVFVSFIAWVADKKGAGSIFFLFLIFGILAISSLCNESKKSPKCKEELDIEKELEELEKREKDIYSSMYVEDSFFAWNLTKRLIPIKMILKKMQIISRDVSLGESDKLLKLESLLSLEYQNLVQAKVSEESSLALEYAQQQANFAQQQANLARQQLIQQQENAKQQEKLAQKLLTQQQESAQQQARELEKQTEIIKEKARLDESRRKDGEPWRF